MIDNETLIAFFDNSKPCPSSVKNCLALRTIYEKDKEKIIQKGCTTCTIANFNEHFIKHVLYKNYFKVPTISSKNINNKTKNIKKKIDKQFIYDNTFRPFNFFYKGKKMQETLYIGKNLMYVVTDYVNNEYIKIYLKIKFFNFRFLLVGKSIYDYEKKLKILLYNEKTRQLYYFTKTK